MNAARVDLHCHSAASATVRGTGAAGLPECATDPDEVYELAKRRGMDFVTITDHDTIDGALRLERRPDAFVSEELTASFRGEPQVVHVLCFGINADDHQWLQRHADDLLACAEYLHHRRIACALAHPFFNVAAPLTPAHRRILADLFPIWETRNGSSARELNSPAAIYIETHGGGGIGGSDDHAGVDIGRTYTETPPARTVDELLEHIRTGQVTAGGSHGSAAKWAHSSLALAARTLARRAPQAPRPAIRPRPAPAEDEPARVALIAGTLGADDPIHELRERGVAGYAIDVIGTDPAVDRRYAAIHLCTPGTASIAALAVGRLLGIPVIGGFDPVACEPLAPVYARCDLVLSPSRFADQQLLQLGIARGQIVHWRAGVDLQLFNPGRYRPDAVPAGDHFDVLHVGDAADHRLLAEAFLVARDRDPRLHLILASGDERLGPKLGSAATPIAAPGPDQLAALYASADLLLFTGDADAHAHVILRAHASGLPVLATDVGAACELIEAGRTGCLVPPEPGALAAAIRGLARRPALRERLATGGLLAVQERSWERSLDALAGAYGEAIDRAQQPVGAPARAA